MDSISLSLRIAMKILRRWHMRRFKSPSSYCFSHSSSEVSSPPPIRVLLTKDSGRGVFASRSISAGELIHTASPLVAHPTPSLTDKVRIPGPFEISLFFRLFLVLYFQVCYYCLRRRGSSDTAAPTSDRYFCCGACLKKSEVRFLVSMLILKKTVVHRCSLRGIFSKLWSDIYAVTSLN